MKDKFTKISLAAVGSAAMLPVTVMASDASSSADAVVASMTTLASDMVSAGTSIVPVALTVVGLSMVVTYGIKIFKRIASK